MKLITQQMKLDNIVEQWKLQNPPYLHWNDINIIRNGQTANQILKKLEALGPNKTVEQVNDIIGLRSWTATICGECGKLNVPIVIPDPEDSCLIMKKEHEGCDDIDDIGFCEDCLKKALQLFK